MRGEGFNPEIAAEARKESGEGAKEQLKRQERSFLDSLRQGAERHRLALSFMFAGALAESMSGSAKAQEVEKPGTEAYEKAYETDDELEKRTFEELQAEAESFEAIIDDLRAPFVYYEGFDEVFREQGTMETSRKTGKKPGVMVRMPAGRTPEGGLGALKDKRVIVTAAAGTFTDLKSVSRSENGETHGSASVESTSKVETAVYAADASEDNDIDSAKAFQTVGWGETRDQAIANALHQAATLLGARVHVENNGFMSSKGEVTLKDDKEISAKRLTQDRRLHIARETAAAVIEGFVVTKIEKVVIPTADGARSYFVANIEGLGETMDFSAPQD